MEKHINIPKLRFPEFKEEWGRNQFGEVCQINPKTEKLPMSFIYIDLESVVSGQLIKEETTEIDIAPSRAQRVLCKGDVLFQMVRPYQQNNLYFDKDGDYVASTGYALIKTSNDSRFIYQYLHLQEFTEQVIEKCTGTSYPAINSKDLSGIYVSIPSLIEQTKIASFLTSVDDRLNQLKKKKSLLDEYKKGVLQKIFSKKIRFKNEYCKYFPDWEDVVLDEILIEEVEKTIESKQYRILSSTTRGLFYQDEYFKREIASKDNTGYKVLRKNQMVLSPQNLWLGNINVNTDYDIGIVSPSYKIFSFNTSKTSVLYCKYFLLTPQMMFKYQNCSEQGASVVRRNLDINQFLNIKIKLPSLPEQTKIANFLTAIDEKINQCSVQIEKMESWKKGLMQQMFC